MNAPPVTGPEPWVEPLRTTLIRTVAIAAAVGVAVAPSYGGWRAWPALAVVMLWPAFGGHWVEILYLNFLRPRLPAAVAPRAVARLVTWFAGGIVLGQGMRATAGVMLPSAFAWLTWAKAGAGFVGVELVAHAFLQARRRPSFYNGRG
ncbi:MAG: hypothetical protein U9Q74_13105 [Gemmatimonadota bacterium]|nr:hypothetical protein [Gemmatimonadota bacterium]